MIAVSEAQLLLNLAGPLDSNVMKDPSFIACSVCCESYHSYCVLGYKYENDDIASPRPLFESHPAILLPNWRCFNCLECEVCRSVKEDDLELLVCYECNEAYHASCLRKVSNAERLEQVIETKWLCPKCVVCENCGCKHPQGRGNSLQGKLSRRP